MSHNCAVSKIVNSFRAALALLAIAVTAANAIAAYQTGKAQAAGANDVHATEYLFRFARSRSRAEQEQAFAALGGTVVTWMPQINVANVRFSDVDTAQQAFATLARSHEVLSVEPNSLVWAETEEIVDPEFNDLQHGYGQHLVQLSLAWTVTEGDPDITVAVLDTGLDLSHPEFAGRVVAGYDFVNEDENPTDDNGHGTHVAGILAMAIDGSGSAGMCPACSIMPLKVLNANSSGRWSAVARAILYATDHGARVVNLSLGSYNYSTTVADAIAYARDHEVLVVASAGNAASATPYYPAALEDVLAVVATDEQDERWRLSNYGPWVDVAAPGVAIYSTHVRDGEHTYALMTGTSMAAPFVSGLAALVMSAQPAVTVEDVIGLIFENADDLGPSGYDDYFGYGRINAAHTLGVEEDDPDPDGDPGDVHDNGVYKIFLPTVVR